MNFLDLFCFMFHLNSSDYVWLCVIGMKSFCKELIRAMPQPKLISFVWKFIRKSLMTNSSSLRYLHYKAYLITIIVKIKWITCSFKRKLSLNSTQKMCFFHTLTALDLHENFSRKFIFITPTKRQKTCILKSTVKIKCKKNLS